MTRRFHASALLHVGDAAAENNSPRMTNWSTAGCFISAIVFCRSGLRFRRRCRWGGDFKLCKVRPGAVLSQTKSKQVRDHSVRWFGGDRVEYRNDRLEILSIRR